MRYQMVLVGTVVDIFDNNIFNTSIKIYGERPPPPVVLQHNEQGYDQNKNYLMT